MAIRKISDLPYLSADELDMSDDVRYNNLIKSTMELSFLSGGTKDMSLRVSKQIEVGTLQDLAVSELKYREVELSGLKKFKDGLSASFVKTGKLSVLTETDLTGNVYINSDETRFYPQEFNGRFAFKSFELSSDQTWFHNAAYVDETKTAGDNSAKSIVNYECLTATVAALQSQIDQLRQEVQQQASKETLEAKKVWPVGAVFITTSPAATCPVADLATGWTWQRIEGYYLFAAGTLATNETFTAGQTIAAGLPKITGA
jgi:hypothetical protein